MTETDRNGTAVYLNTADPQELSQLGISSEQAQALIDARPLRQWGDLKRIDGIDQDQINAMKSAGAVLGEPAEGPIGEPGSGGSPADDYGRA